MDNLNNFAQAVGTDVKELQEKITTLENKPQVDVSEFVSKSELNEILGKFNLRLVE